MATVCLSHNYLDHYHDHYHDNGYGNGGSDHLWPPLKPIGQRLRGYLLPLRFYSYY